MRAISFPFLLVDLNRRRSQVEKQEKGKPPPSLYENEKGEKVKIKTETKGEGVEAFGYEESGLEATHTITAAGAVEIGA